MSRSNDESARIDLLLALSLAFGEADAPRADASRVEGTTPRGDDIEGYGGSSDRGANAQARGRESGAARARDPFGVFSAHSPSVRQAVERRADWYSRLPPQKQRAWLAHMLGGARESPPRLDEHVHPSHVVEALRGEPPRVRELVISHLPPALAAAAAAQLGTAAGAVGDAARSGVVTRDGGAARLGAAAGDEPGRDESRADAPTAEVEAVVRREFLSRFVSFASLGRATAVDQLSGAELARLVRLLGVRETAVACRGIEAIEAVASFLRRFAPEDAHAIAAHIKSLTEVEPRHVTAAEQTVREALLAEANPAAILDRVGLRLLALSLAGRENRARLRYAAQKLPVEAARWLEASVRAAESAAEGSDAETRRAAARAAEAVAGGLLQGRHARRPRHAAPHAAETFAAPLSPEPNQ